jgi:hypothetical protein
MGHYASEMGYTPSADKWERERPFREQLRLEWQYLSGSHVEVTGVVVCPMCAAVVPRSPELQLVHEKYHHPDDGTEEEHDG